MTQAFQTAWCFDTEDSLPLQMLQRTQQLWHVELQLQDRVEKDELKKP